MQVCQNQRYISGSKASSLLSPEVGYETQPQLYGDWEGCKAACSAHSRCKHANYWSTENGGQCNFYYMTIAEILAYNSNAQQSWPDAGSQYHPIYYFEHDPDVRVCQPPTPVPAPAPVFCYTNTIPCRTIPIPCHTHTVSFSYQYCAPPSTNVLLTEFPAPSTLPGKPGQTAGGCRSALLLPSFRAPPAPPGRPRQTAAGCRSSVLFTRFPFPSHPFRGSRSSLMFTLRESPPAHPKTAVFAKCTGYRELSVCVLCLSTGGRKERRLRRRRR